MSRLRRPTMHCRHDRGGADGRASGDAAPEIDGRRLTAGG
jgi:hypothetical protein